MEARTRIYADPPSGQQVLGSTPTGYQIFRWFAHRKYHDCYRTRIHSVHDWISAARSPAFQRPKSRFSIRSPCKHECHICGRTPAFRRQSIRLHSWRRARSVLPASTLVCRWILFRRTSCSATPLRPLSIGLHGWPCPNHLRLRA